MTGYKSKRAAAQDKLLDDDDTLTIAYATGYYDGKKAAQTTQEPVAYLCKPDQHGLFAFPTPDKACKDCFPVYAAPPQPAHEPWRESASDYERGFIDGMQKQMQSSVDKAVNAMTQRPWVDLTDEEIDKTYRMIERSNRPQPTPLEFARDLLTKFKEKNNGTTP